VLLNLCENARLAEATTVRLALEAVDGGLRLTVQDDGVGIPKALLPRLFEPRFSTRTSGTGLGLAICRRLVSGWGGAIGIDSVEGQGTTVTVVLPVTSGRAEPAGPTVV
jgi:signal transduction histidine kinase